MSDDTLIGTAWIYHGPPQEGESVHFFYTEVVTVQGDDAILVAPLSNERPSPTWKVPVAILTNQYSAFRPLGPAADLNWIRTGRWVVSLDKPANDPFGGTWQIDLVIDVGVFMHPRNTRVVSATWFDVRRKFRPATPEEIREVQPEPALPAAPEPPHDSGSEREPEPTPPSDPPPPAWARLPRVTDTP